jgi:hypothetical protein
MKTAFPSAFLMKFQHACLARPGRLHTYFKAPFFNGNRPSKFEATVSEACIFS